MLSENTKNYGRQIIDDFFLPEGPLPRCKLEDTAQSENAKRNWHEANIRFAACASMYKYLDEQGILKKEAFCYDVIPEQTVDGKHYDRQVNFAVDSRNLLKYKEQMLNSGVENADIATAYILADPEHTVEPSHYSGATCLTWTMQTYRDSGGCVGRSWETIHEQCYNLKHVVGIGGIAEKRNETLRKLENHEISEDEYFETVKSGIKDIYKLDREAILSKVPKSKAFVRDTKNPEWKMVFLPCGKNISDNGKLMIMVPTEKIYEMDSKYTILLGDFERNLSASVLKDGEYKKIKVSAGKIASKWEENRKANAEKFKEEHSGPVSLTGVPKECVKQAMGGDCAVSLPSVGTIYVSPRQIEESEEGNTVSVNFESGLFKEIIYRKDENGSGKEYSSVWKVEKMWNKQKESQPIEEQQENNEEEEELEL